MRCMENYVRVFRTIIAAAACTFGAGEVAAEPGCRTGGVAAANAYVLFNPIYAMYFGDFESYISKNGEHFRANSDAVRCLAALSSAFLSASIQLYDPADMQRKQYIDAQLGSMGISPGPQQPNAATTLFGMGMQLSRLARGLPAAANGDYGPLNTPTNELEQMQQVAMVMLRQLMQDPTVRSTFAALEPLIREGAQLEHKMITQAAERLANTK